MIDAVLIANRGEIAVRVARTLREVGMGSVAVFTDADEGSPHATSCDVAVRIPSYLDAEAVVAAAGTAGADAVHPGYGFLSENADFARSLSAAGLTWVGPPADAIELMGDKARAKRLAREVGVPVVPGTDGDDVDGDELEAFACAQALPIVIKAVAGGGGKGMRVVRDGGELPRALAAARREAKAAFGDGRMLAERYLERPRHIEVQVLADRHGSCVHLGERECSLQRRHQKVIEEAPSPAVDAALRERMGACAVALAVACGYEGAGTVEFIVPAASDEFFFLEMNTRLQVEHPVTELVYGVDLVAEQLAVAAGEPLRLSAATLAPRGHAVEARLYAEDPAAGFLPASGKVLAYRAPSGPGVRVDSGIRLGAEIGTAYDPMLAKVIAHGPNRAGALRRLERALAELEVLGVSTNAAFSRTLLRRGDVRSGELDTGLLERVLAELVPPVPEDLLPAGVWAAFRTETSGETMAPGPWRRELAEHGQVRVSGTTVSAGRRCWTVAELPSPGAGGLALEVDGVLRAYVVAHWSSSGVAEHRRERASVARRSNGQHETCPSRRCEVPEAATGRRPFQGPSMSIRNGTSRSAPVKSIE